MEMEMESRGGGRRERSRERGAELGQLGFTWLLGACVCGYHGFEESVEKARVWVRPGAAEVIVILAMIADD